MLSSLLGGGGLGQISSVLSRFTGVSEDAIGKLLGLLAPIVMSAIGKQAKGLDGAGIANMLAGQKGNIASALPSGLGSLLSSAVPGLSSFVGDASNAATSVTRMATNVASGATREVEAAGSSFMKWLIPLRGGSFLCTDQYCTRYMVGTRGKGEVRTASNHVGFRCVKPPEMAGANQ